MRKIWLTEQSARSLFGEVDSESQCRRLTCWKNVVSPWDRCLNTLCRGEKGISARGWRIGRLGSQRVNENGISRVVRGSFEYFNMLHSLKNQNYISYEVCNSLWEQVWREKTGSSFKIQLMLRGKAFIKWGEFYWPDPCTQIQQSDTVIDASWSNLTAATTVLPVTCKCLNLELQIFSFLKSSL